MDISEFNASTFQSFNRLAVLTPDINIGLMFKESSNMCSSRGCFGDIWSEGKELSCSLGTKHDGHHADKEL